MNINNKFAGVAGFVSVYGYFVLISYTWPLGFVPIVSIESLPILLLGFAVECLLVLGIGLFLVAPYYILKNKLIIYAFVMDIKGVFDDRNIQRFKKISIIKLIKKVWSKLGLVGLWYYLFGYVVIIFLSLFVIFFFILRFGFSIDLMFSILFFVVVFYLSVKVLGKSDVRTAVFPFVLLSAITVVIPSMYPSLFRFIDEPYSKYGSNPLIGESLRLVGLGGGVKVNVNSGVSGSTPLVKGELIFSDGKNAWLNIGDKDVVLMHVKYDSIVYER